MHNAVLVRSSMRVWDLVLLITFGLVLALVGLLCAANRALPVALFLFWPVAGLVILGSIWGWVRRVQLRLWVRDTGSGFVLSDRQGEREMRDDVVVTLSLRHNNHYSGGVLNSITRILCVWIASHDDRPEKKEFTTTFKFNEADPLQGLIQRLCQRLFDQAQDDLQRGLSVLGEHWKWQEGELTIREKTATKQCPIAEVAAVDVVDGHVCVWCKEQDEVWGRVPQGSANAYLLQWLVVKELGQRAPDNAPPPEGQLGRIIFQRDGRQQRGIGLVLAIVLLLGALAVVGVAITERIHGLLWLPPVFVLAAFLLGLFELSCWRSCFRCHDYGVYQRGLWSEKTLRYTEVQAFTYAAVRQFHNGIYAGTMLSMCFEPQGSGQKLTYNAHMQNPDAALDNLRDLVSKVVAARMAQQWHSGETVVWTPQLSFRPTGVLCKPAGFFGAKPQQMVKFDEIQSYDIQEGYFYLWRRGEKKPLITEIVTTRNFYPGFYLFLSILHPPQPNAVGALPADAAEPTSDGIEILEEEPKQRPRGAIQEDPYAR